MAQDAKLTRRQELGSAWIFRRALKENKRYNTWEDILKDPKYPELGGAKGIYPDIDVAWLKNFYKQQKKMLQEFSDVKFSEFNREYGFMEYISNLVMNKFGISKKDNWDPADIWCIKNQKKVISDIEKLVKSGDYSTIEQLNQYLRTLFKDRIVVGVSLKLVSGKEAKYEEVNVSKAEFKDVKHPDYETITMKCDLSLKSADSLSPNNKYSYFVLQGYQDGNKVDFTIEIGAQSGSKYSYTKFEAKSSAAKSSRLGKAEIAIVRELFKQYKIPLASKSALDYPQNSTEFMERQDEFLKKFKIINGNKKIKTGITTDKEFLQNMAKYFMNVENGKPVTANNKCIQLDIFAGLASLSDKKRNELGTKIVIASQKKDNDKYGPFGKLY
jgi:hypothetical protein